VAWGGPRAAVAPPPRAPELAARIERIVGAVVVEGSGGAAVPLNENETISDVALACKLEALIVVGLRLGCINHALLTREFLERRGIPVRGALLCECRPDVPVSYAAEVEAVLGVRMPVLGTIPFYATYAVRAEAAFAIARRFLRGRLPEVALLEVNE
jgi:dethiobiotin synthetase